MSMTTKLCVFELVEQNRKRGGDGGIAVDLDRMQQLG